MCASITRIGSGADKGNSGFGVWFALAVVLLGGCGDGKTDTSGSGNGGNANTPPAIASFSASPTSINSGGSSVLSWSVTGATSVSIDQQIGVVTASGQRTVRPTATSTYTLTATNAKGTRTAQQTITVTALPVVSAFSATPTSINSGGNSVLSWNVTGATSVSIDQEIGTVTTSGQQTVSPTATITYTLTAANAAGTRNASATVTVTSLQTGWLYTKSGSNKIYVNNGSGETVWMGRGVNMDDVFHCGYNNSLWMTNPSGEKALQDIVTGLMRDWKPNFVRVSLGMHSYADVSWLTTPSQYRTSMEDVINALGAYPGVYVLVTLRSDTSMNNCNSDDAVCIPADSTDAVYNALVDSFKDRPFVIFGLSNEPGGNTSTSAALRVAMSHAADVIRAREDTLGVPHHIIAVQGNNWTSRIDFYSTTPLTQDNVVYEYHSYPPETTGTYGYTYPNIPVIIGEYGNLSQSEADAFHADVEAKSIPILAWDFSPFSNCAPDLLHVTHSATNLDPTAWGSIIQSYLLSHTP